MTKNQWELLLTEACDETMGKSAKYDYHGCLNNVWWNNEMIVHASTAAMRERCRAYVVAWGIEAGLKKPTVKMVPAKPNWVNNSFISRASGAAYV